MIEQHIKNLEEYCQDDDLFEKDGDFKEFCDNHIADIEAVIQELRTTQSDLYEANHRITDLLLILGDRDRIIDLMAEQLAGLTIWDNKKDEPLILMSKEEVIKYFEERCNDAENKS